jgi:hypothetical protein
MCNLFFYLPSPQRVVMYICFYCYFLKKKKKKKKKFGVEQRLDLSSVIPNPGHTVVLSWPPPLIPSL